MLALCNRRGNVFRPQLAPSRNSNKASCGQSAFMCAFSKFLLDSLLTAVWGETKLYRLLTLGTSKRLLVSLSTEYQNRGPSKVAVGLGVN